MTDSGGFAVALTIREELLRDALLVAYGGGDFPHTLNTGAGGLPGSPQAGLDVFLAPPAVACHQNNTMTVTLELWGQLGATVNGLAETAQIHGRLAVDLVPAFLIVMVGVPQPDGSTKQVPFLKMDAGRTTLTVSPVTGWDFTVIAAPDFSADADAYLRSAAFIERLQQAISQAVVSGMVPMPSIEADFLGKMATAVNSRAESRVRQGSILVGLNMNNPPIVGDADRLQDFAQDNQLAAVVAAPAVPILLQDVRAALADGVSKRGGSLDGPVTISADLGRFRVAGEASNSYGTASFSFSIVPTLVAFRPGKVFTYVLKPRHVNSRSWSALGFTVSDIAVDVDAYWFVDMGAEILEAVNVMVIPALVATMQDRSEEIAVTRRRRSCRSAATSTSSSCAADERRRKARAGGCRGACGRPGRRRSRGRARGSPPGAAEARAPGSSPGRVVGEHAPRRSWKVSSASAWRPLR